MIPVLDVVRTKIPVPCSIFKICKFDSYCSGCNTLDRLTCVGLVVVVVVVVVGMERAVKEEEEDMAILLRLLARWTAAGGTVVDSIWFSFLWTYASYNRRWVFPSR